MASLLYRPDQKELMSISRMARSMDGRVLVEVLEAELAVAQKMLIDAEAKETPKLQGRARFLADFIALLKEQAKKDAPLS